MTGISKQADFAKIIYYHFNLNVKIFVTQWDKIIDPKKLLMKPAGIKSVSHSISDKS